MFIISCELREALREVILGLIFVFAYRNQVVKMYFLQHFDLKTIVLTSEVVRNAVCESIRKFGHCEVSYKRNICGNKVLSRKAVEVSSTARIELPG